MAEARTSGRTAAEQRIERAQRTTEEARAVIEREFLAQRRKTAALREQRLAKEAAERAPAQHNALRRKAARS